MSLVIEAMSGTNELDAMNAKQRLKEFKGAQKDVKSKDLVVKNAVLKKFQDIRYLTEGGCLLPFINSMIPKKVWRKLL